MKIKHLVLASIITAVSTLSFANVNKWVDDQGKVHFIDEKTKAEKELTLDKAAEEIGIKQVPMATPIEPEEHFSNRMIVLESISLDITDTQKEFGIGQIRCGKKDLLSLDAAELVVQRDITGFPMMDAMEQYGYSVRIGRAEKALGELSLAISITDINIDHCPSAQSHKLASSSAFVEVEWYLRDKAMNQAVYIGRSEGSFNGSSLLPKLNAANGAFNKALLQATFNLLGDAQFLASLPSKEFSLPQQIAADDSPASGEKSAFQKLYSSIYIWLNEVVVAF